MSTGHVDLEMIPDREWQQLLRTVPELEKAWYELDTLPFSHAFDMPYGAGYSVGGTRWFLDRDVPLRWAMRRVLGGGIVRAVVLPFPRAHEGMEVAAHLAFPEADYDWCHHVGNYAEVLMLRNAGFDPEHYNAQWAKYIKKDEFRALHEQGDLVMPEDFDLFPMRSDKGALDARLIPVVEEAMRKAQTQGSEERQ